jgi:DNA-binding CsgD family transcriptional regulator
MPASPAAQALLAKRDQKALRLLAAGMEPILVRERLGLNRRTLEAIRKRARESGHPEEPGRIMEAMP